MACEHQIAVITHLSRGTVQEADILRYMGHLVGTDSGGIDKIERLIMMQQAAGHSAKLLTNAAMVKSHP